MAEHTDRAVSGSVLRGVAEPDERYTAALERIAAAIELQAESNRKLAASFDMMERGMMKMVGTIQGAQKIIGGEAGKVVEKSKAMNRKLAAEMQRVRESRG